MIGIVIVSHSRQLADGLKELACAMSAAPVPIASAGGVDDAAAPIGTDALAVLAAIRAVNSRDGCLVFADMGSARLNAEMAVDLLDADAQATVRICDAPFVEGVLAAAVQSAAGGTIDAVQRAAAQARSTEEQVATGLSRRFVVTNPNGLHARPAAQLVKALSGFAGDISLINATKAKPPANAKSINAVLLSEVTCGDEIEIIAPSEAVFAALEGILRPVPPRPAISPAIATGPLTGIAVSPGYATGPLQHLSRDMPDIAAETVTDIDAEVSRFDAALTGAERDIKDEIAALGESLSRYDQKIFDAHIALLTDTELTGKVRDRIKRNQTCAQVHWIAAIRDLARDYEALSDPLLKARAADLRDVGHRVLGRLTGVAATQTWDHPVILALQELRPSDVLTLDTSAVLGICTAQGSKTSHAGILASMLRIPVVFGLGAGVEQIKDGSTVLLDGVAGELVDDPDAERVSKMEAARAAWQAHRTRAEAVRHKPAQTKDGHRVRVAANMASVDEVGVIANSGAEEVGLLRTEFMFMRRTSAPDEDEQTAAYRAIVEGLDGKPLTIRTVDIGGDKPVPFMDRPAETNPNLGWRGIRYSLDQPALFQIQLRAILRASAFGPVRIMFPLISTLDEVRAAKAQVQTVKAALRAKDIAFDPGIETGIMIEVPAAVEMARALAPEVDFFSIGTNDLTQYVMASDRGNPRVQALFDPFNPAVLRMISRAITAAHDADIWIGMCGAMAGSPLAAPVLIGMGLDEFSMTPSDIPDFKLAVRNASLATCRTLAAEVIDLTSAQAVRAHLASRASA